MIKINQKHLERSRHILGEEPVTFTNLKMKYFKSYDERYLEKQVNEFLDDEIYVKHSWYAIEVKPPEVLCLTDKTDLYLYYAIVYYEDWPF